jgi:hypothetical protein
MVQGILQEGGKRGLMRLESDYGMNAIVSGCVGSHFLVEVEGC